MQSRPKSNETEEDLLRFQKAFFDGVRGKRDGVPAVTTAAAVPTSQISRVEKRKERGEHSGHLSLENETDIQTTGKKVKFRLPDDGDESADDDNDRMEVETEQLNTKKHRNDYTFNSADLDVLDAAGIVTDVVECNVDSRVGVREPTRTDVFCPFPKVIHCDPKDFAKSTERRGSIFARQFQKMGATKREIKEPLKSQSHLLTSGIVDGSGLDASHGQGLAREIHEENVAKLSKMTKEQILQERSRLISTIDPNLLEFLMARNRHGSKEESDDGKGGDGTVFSKEVVESDPSESVVTARMAVDDLPIPLTDVSKCVNMSKVEMEKLEWTTSLPEPKPFDPMTGYLARFDFEGRLLSRDQNISVRAALHHHGEEPEVAGYTLKELFIYSRSSVLQQRVLGLSTLAKILAKNGEGYYDECLSVPLVPQLLDSGIVLLLRWAMDDNTEGSLGPCVAALHALVVNVADELCLDQTLTWCRGEAMPYVRPASGEEDCRGKSADEVEGEKELSDAELVKLDVVNGLIRMDVLPRLRYVLEVLQPSAQIVVHILEILARIARHSLQAANAVATCPRLISVVVNNFVKLAPLNGDQTRKQLPSRYGSPIHQAIKLIRILMSAGRHLASELDRTHNVVISILSYMNEIPSKNSMSSTEVVHIIMEMHRTWRVFLTYGMAAEFFRICYPLISRQMHFYEGLSVNTDVLSKTFDYDLAAELFATVGAIIPNVGEESVIAWDSIVGMQIIVKNCFAKWLWQLTHSDEQTTSSMLKLVGVMFTVLVTFYRASKLQPSFNAVELVNEIDNLLHSSLVPFMRSELFSRLFSRMSSSSFLLSDLKLGTDRDPTTLPSLGAILWGGRLTPLLDENSPLVFLGHFCHSLCALKCIRGGLDDHFRSFVFSNEHVIRYVKQLGTEALYSSVTRGRHWFARFEVNFVCDLLQLSSPRPLHPRSCHTAAMAVMHWMQSGDEEIASNLMSSVVFNSEFLSEVIAVEAAIRELSMNESNSMRSKQTDTSNLTESDRNELLRQTLDNLPSIYSTYSAVLLRPLPNSNSSFSRDTLAVRYSPGSIVTGAFEFLPLLTFSQSPPACALSGMGGSVSAAPSCRTVVIHCLQWCHLLGCLRGDFFERSNAEAQFCQFAMIFLVDSNLFLDPSLRRYLEDIVQLMSRRNSFSKMNFESVSLTCVSSFPDFYAELLTQFEAVSYGDRLFGIFVLIPMQMRYLARFRRTVWTEHTSALRSLGVRFDELPVPVKEFLTPNEEDYIILGAYLSALLRGLVRPDWCPVLYLVAVHHVHKFLFGPAGVLSEEATSLASNMLKRLESSKSSVVYQHVVHYRGHDPAASLGFCTDN